MALPRDLDEYTEEELRNEITRRAASQANGNCDYCHRAASLKPCKFPLRHAKAARKPKVRK